MKHAYNKLVRDKIPTIIIESGRHCEFQTLEGEALLDALKEKLIEKAEVFSKRATADELSDIYDLLDTIVEKFDYEPMYIDYLKMQNKERKGSYSGNTFLLYIEDDQEN